MADITAAGEGVKCSIAQNCLFTEAIHKPQIYTGQQREILFAARIDQNDSNKDYIIFYMESNKMNVIAVLHIFLISQKGRLISG